MKFLVDNQLPVALDRFLNSLGNESLQVVDVGLSTAPDSVLWNFAAERRLVLVSKDLDFFHRAATPGAAVQLVWIRLGNCRKAELLAAVERTWVQVCACLQAGERIVEIR